MTEKQEKYLKEYRQKNKERIRIQKLEYRKKQRKTSIQHRLRYNYRRQVQRLLNGKDKRSITKYIDLIGCDKFDFLIHLLFRFNKDMSFNNYGEVWSIYHIIPCSKFDLTDYEQVKKCFNYSNLRPVYIHENTKKGNRIE